MRALILICLCFLFPLPAYADDTVRLGALIHLSGEMAATGQGFREGLELGVRDVNASGKLGSRKFELIFEDTQYKPLQALTGAKKLARQDHVLATFITTVTEAKAAGPELSSQNVPSIVLWDSSPEVEALGRNFFGIGPWAPASGESSADFAFKKLSARTAVVLSSNTEWSLFVSDFFSKRFKELGGIILHSESINPDEVDYRPALQRAKMKKAAVWYVPIDGNVAPFFKQARSLGVDTPLITSDIITDELLQAADGSFEGVYQSMTGDPDSAEAMKLYDSYQQYFNKPVSQASFVAWGYDAVQMVASAVMAGGTDRHSLGAALHRVRDFHGVSGPITMSENGSAPRPIRVFQLVKGKFVAPREPH